MRSLRNSLPTHRIPWLWQLLKSSCGVSPPRSLAKQRLILESTLAGRTLRHVLRTARDAGFTITIVYLFLDSPDTCVERVHERVMKGGHSVPEVDIRRRFLRSIRNFWRLYRPLADHWLLVYNSGNQPLDVAAGTAADVSVRDAELYAVFSRWMAGGTDG